MPVSMVKTQPMASSALAAPMQWPEHALHARDGHPPIAEDVADDLRLRQVVVLGPGAVRVDEVDVCGRDARALDGRAHRHDAPHGLGMRARDVVRVARQPVAANLGVKAGAAPVRVGLALEDEEPRALAEQKALPVQVERLTPLGRHRREAHEAAELQLLQELRGAGHDHVGAARADQIGREGDRVVARGAGGRQGEHHPPGAERARHVDGQESRAVARDERPGDRPLTPEDPLLLELGEDLRLAHRRAEHHGRARTRELGRQDLRVANGHARRGEGHRRAPTHPPLLAVGQVVARVEVFDLTGIFATQR